MAGARTVYWVSPAGIKPFPATLNFKKAKTGAREAKKDLIKF